MKAVINPKYEYLREWIEQIPFFFEDSGEVIYKGRNTIKVFSIDKDMEMNVKRYRKPILLNRIAYTFFRKSKSCRAYHNALKITDRGFETAEAVGYMEMKRNGLLSDCYFISLQCNGVKEMREYYFSPLAGNESLLEAFARYSAALHDAGIYHLDYSPGNILIRIEDGKYAFTLIDVNRMKFKPVSYVEGCKNFARLFEHDAMYQYIGQVYAQSRKKSLSQEETIRLIMHYKNKYLHRQACKKRLKQLFK
jgi:serine/threonine protein kinase